MRDLVGGIAIYGRGCHHLRLLMPREHPRVLSTLSLLIVWSVLCDAAPDYYGELERCERLMSRFRIGVDVSENEADPRQFLECAVLAEKIGLDSIWFGDHFMPWNHTGGKSAFVWSLMASSLERTERISIGPDVTSPIGGRFHPAIVAQAAATLDNMYPGRFMLGVGSGEGVNEAVFFQEQKGSWPRWKERIERVAEATTLMRELWARQEYFSFKGKYFSVSNVLLYTKPKTEIPIYFSATGPKSASYAGRYGDHLITISPPNRCRDLIFPKFNEAISAKGKNPDDAEKMVLLNFMLGDPEESLTKLKRGPAGYLVEGSWDQADPRQIERLCSTLDDAVIKENIPLCPTVDDLIEVVKSYIKVGTDHVVFGTGPSPDLIKLIGDQVVPAFR